MKVYFRLKGLMVLCFPLVKDQRLQYCKMCKQTFLKPDAYITAYHLHLQNLLDCLDMSYLTKSWCEWGSEVSLCFKKGQFIIWEVRFQHFSLLARSNVIQQIIPFCRKGISPHLIFSSPFPLFLALVLQYERIPLKQCWFIWESM